MKKLILFSKDHEIIMKNKILPPNERNKNHVFTKTLKEITQQDIDFYFENKEDTLKNINLEIKKNSLLPNRVLNM